MARATSKPARGFASGIPAPRNTIGSAVTIVTSRPEPVVRCDANLIAVRRSPS